MADAKLPDPVLAELQKMNDHLENIEMILILSAIAPSSGGADVHDGNFAMSKLVSVLEEKKDKFKKRLISKYGAY